MGPGRLGARRAEGELLMETRDLALVRQLIRTLRPSPIPAQFVFSLSLPLYIASVVAIKKSSVLVFNGKVLIFCFVSLLS